MNDLIIKQCHILFDSIRESAQRCLRGESRERDAISYIEYVAKLRLDQIEEYQETTESDRTTSTRASQTE